LIFEVHSTQAPLSLRSITAWLGEGLGGEAKIPVSGYSLYLIFIADLLGKSFIIKDKMANTYRELNLEFYDALNQIFKINKKQTWSELSKEITIDKISETYKAFGEIFPITLDRYSLLPKNDPKEKLTSIFHGTLDGLSIIGNIARYSLYCDEIIVFHPLQNPQNINPKYDPITKTEQWRYIFVNDLYFYIVLQKWVKAGIVNLIENPFMFDHKVMDSFLSEARKRVDATEKLFDIEELKTEHDEMMMQKLQTSTLGLPLAELEKVVAKQYSYYSPEQVKQQAADLKQYAKTLPLYVDFGDNIEAGSLFISKTGGNIEMIDSLCKITGAHSYTTEKVIKKQLELIGENPFWTKFGTLYGGLKLTYLDNVDTAFALQIREENRIAGLRTALRDLGSFLEETELDKITDDRILYYNERISDEIKRSEVEWSGIIDYAQKAKLGTLLGANAIALIIDPTKIIIPSLISIPTSILVEEIFKSRGLKNYRAKNPYSVYVDLKNKKPSFFSDFKNCIM
jgi:hypothetical protein